MECFIVIKDDVDLERRELRLAGEEAHHAIKSLRLRAGESFLATDLEGMCYGCMVTDLGGKDATQHATLTATIEEIIPEFGEPKRDVLLVPALIAQPTRWEFLLEKATELGARAIQPITSERTEREHFNRERSERILRAAVKQTKRARLPELRELSSLEPALRKAAQDGRIAIVLHEGADGSDSFSSVELGTSAVAIFIGPEGGFSEREVALARSAGAEIRSLGARRLRAETAALAALAIIMSTEHG